jgi:putative membrane protein
MKRLTLDMILAGTLAVAPLAVAQSETPAPGSAQIRDDTTPANPRPTPSTTRRTTPPSAEGEPVPAQRVPPDVPPAGMPTPSTSTTTGSEKAGNQPGEATPAPAAREEAEGDLALVKKVHEANQKEIELGQLASDKARSEQVKSYARKLVSDHKAADRQLMSYADKKGMTSRLEQAAAATPVTPDTSVDMKARLMGETGEEFDHDFVATMVDEHDKAIEMVRSARDAATDPQFRHIFDGMLPKLEHHRKMAQQLLDKKTKSKS